MVVTMTCCPYQNAIALVKAFLARKATIGQLRALVREAEKEGEKPCSGSQKVKDFRSPSQTE